MRAGEEEEEAALPAWSDDGQADSSLCWRSGDKPSLLLSSSKAYESSALGNFPWFTEGAQRSEVSQLHPAYRSQ